jgi:hypothetical protein
MKIFQKKSLFMEIITNNKKNGLFSILFLLLITLFLSCDKSCSQCIVERFDRIGNSIGQSAGKTKGECDDAKANKGLTNGETNKVNCTN